MLRNWEICKYFNPNDKVCKHSFIGGAGDCVNHIFHPEKENGIICPYMDGVGWEDLDDPMDGDINDE